MLFHSFSILNIFYTFFANEYRVRMPFNRYLYVIYIYLVCNLFSIANYSRDIFELEMLEKRYTIVPEPPVFSSFPQLLDFNRLQLNWSYIRMKDANVKISGVPYVGMIFSASAFDFKICIFSNTRAFLKCFWCESYMSFWILRPKSPARRSPEIAFGDRFSFFMGFIFIHVTHFPYATSYKRSYLAKLFGPHSSISLQEISELTRH